MSHDRTHEDGYAPYRGYRGKGICWRDTWGRDPLTLPDLQIDDGHFTPAGAYVFDGTRWVRLPEVVQCTSSMVAPGQLYDQETWEPEPPVAPRPPLPLLPVTINDFGGSPVAEHNLPCAVCGAEKAVLNLNTGHFAPGWNCQRQGWRTVRLARWQRWLLGVK